MACGRLGSHLAQAADPSPCTCLRPLNYRVWMQLSGLQDGALHALQAGRVELTRCHQLPRAGRLQGCWSSLGAAVQPWGAVLSQSAQKIQSGSCQAEGVDASLRQVLGIVAV